MMGRKVYLSFLGLGQYDKEQNKYIYHETVYEYEGKKAAPIRFVQVAEQELLGWDYFDNIYIAATTLSKDTHYSALIEHLCRCRAEITLIELDEEMSNAGQWKWFEKIFDHIQKGDELCVDLTHGYRTIPVIFSAAINFLQKTKNIHLVHVFYGAYEKDKKCTPLVDMKSFFDINIWADAVTRLIEDADAGGIMRAGGNTNKHQFPELADNTFVTACSDVTSHVKSVDVNNVADKVGNLLSQIDIMQETCPPGTAILLDLVKEKFRLIKEFSNGNPDKNGYTLSYFKSQIEFGRLLLHHGLHMQAFTVMREWLSSLVMLYFEKNKKMNAGKRRKKVEYYGSTFFNMLQYEKEEWNFKGKDAEDKRERVEAFYDELAATGILTPLITSKPTVAKTLAIYRNGFDHGWLGKSGMKKDIEQKGKELLRALEDCLLKLKEGTIEISE